MKTTITSFRFQCDRCSTQQEERFNQSPEGWRDFYDYRGGHKIDLCPSCVNEFYEWLHRLKLKKEVTGEVVMEEVVVND